MSLATTPPPSSSPSSSSPSLCHPQLSWWRHGNRMTFFTIIYIKSFSSHHDGRRNVECFTSQRTAPIQLSGAKQPLLNFQLKASNESYKNIDNDFISSRMCPSHDTHSPGSQSLHVKFSSVFGLNCFEQQHSLRGSSNHQGSVPAIRSHNNNH